MNLQPWTVAALPQQDCLCGPEVPVIKGSTLCHELPGARGGRAGDAAVERFWLLVSTRTLPMPRGRWAWSSQLPPSSASCSSTGAGSEGCARGVSWEPSRSRAWLTLVVPVPGLRLTTRGRRCARPCQTLLPVRCSSVDSLVLGSEPPRATRRSGAAVLTGAIAT